jgi:lysophospholipase L1-like esterase
VNRNALLVREAMFRLAEKHHAAVWDFFSIMGGLDSIRAWEQSGLAKKDKVHLTVSGYLLKADLLSLAIKEDFGNFLENKYLSAGKVD